MVYNSVIKLTLTKQFSFVFRIQLRGGHRLVFQKKLVKIKPWQVIESWDNLIGASSSQMIHVKTEPSEVVSNDFEEVSIDGSDTIGEIATRLPKVNNEVIVYMCSICKLYFPLKRMLDEHKSVHANTNKEQKLTEGQRIFYAGYHKVKSGQYVCNYCPFRSFVRTTVSSHTARKHASLVQNNTDFEVSQGKLEANQKSVFKVEIFEDDDEDSWPMEVVEELEENKSEMEEIVTSKIRICPYCSFHTCNSSTFHSHIKRKHRESWLKSIEKNVVPLETITKLDINVFKCQRCQFVTPKRAILRAHILRKHESPEIDSDVKENIDDKDKKVIHLEQYSSEITESEEVIENEEVVVFDSAKIACASEDEVEEEEGEIVDTTEADSPRKSQKCPLCPFETWINSTMQSHISRCHQSEFSFPNATKQRVLQLPPRTNARRLPNAQLYTGYACHYCTFVAATVASINSHTAREHQGQKQPIKEVPVTEYDCDQCDYKSRNRRNMQLHVKRCHTAQANAEGMFACHACSYETLSRMGLKRHISIKHNKPRRDGGTKEKYECDECDFKCLNGKTMDWHKRQHNAPPNAEDDGNSYFCNDCDFSTWTKGQLYLHIKRKHRDAEGNSREPESEPVEHVFACEQCDYTSKNKHVMKVHVIRKHTNDYNHECEICGKKYKIKADLTNHIRFQHREQPIICDVCGKTCRNSNLLYLHQKFAHYKPEFECPICHRRMVSQANLDDHILKQHEQREDAVCEECGKKFTKQARLKIHMRIHTGIKPYTCKVCLKAFARRNGLRQHLLIHTGQRPYICDICGKSFTQKTGLICHRKSHPGLHPPLPRVTIDHVLSDLLNEEC